MTTTPVKKKGSAKPNTKNRTQSLDSNDDDDQDNPNSNLNQNVVKLSLEPNRLQSRRISMAKDLIASGRELSISLQPDTTRSSSHHNTEHNDFETREMWKDQLTLMRTFYDWDEIPLDFFVDTFVGGEQHRRLSVQIMATSPPPARPTPPPVVVVRDAHSEYQNTPPVYSPPPPHVVATTTTTATTKTKPEVEPFSLNTTAVEPLAATTVSSSPFPVVSAPPLPVRKTRATSVAMGENALSVIRGSQHHPASAAANHHHRPSAMVPLTSQDEETPIRPRAPSLASIDQVYGKRNGQPTKFEFDNPLLVTTPVKSPVRQQEAAAADQRRSSQVLKNLTFDASKFAQGNRPYRESIVEEDEDQTLLQLLVSDNPGGRESRTMSEWM